MTDDGRTNAEIPGVSAGSPAVLYVIHGSHACRSAMLMLEHKGIPYRSVVLTTGLHPLSVRAHGFSGNAAPIRSVGVRSNRALGLMDRMGTVPALRIAGRRAQTNREIARLLDRLRSVPPLFPADAERRRAVEDAERWGDGELQMAARRIVMAGAIGGLDAMHQRGNDGRLGPLLSRSELVRGMANGISARFIFRASGAAESELLSALPAQLDRIDAWIGEGVLDADELNAADFMIAPSLALLSYRSDLRAELEARPLARLLDRVLPEPGGVPLAGA